MTAKTRDYVTVVSGLPRSGTSMVMRMLEVGGIAALTDNIRKADEDNPMGYYEFEPVKKTAKDPSWAASAVGKAVKLVYRLLYDLPADHQYRVVFMRRALEEVVASQNVMLDRHGKQGGDLSDAQLMETFRREIDRVRDWLSAQPNFRTLDVDYNEVLKSAAGPVRSLNEFLGGDLDTQQMLAVVDPALYRQRKGSAAGP